MQCYCSVLLLLVVLFVPNCVAFDSSGEYFHSHFIPYHSDEEDFYVHKPAVKPKTNYQCFGYKNYPILNNYPIRPKKAPPPLFIDELDATQYVPKGRDRFYDIDDDDETETPKKKIPFDVCFETCPASKEEKMVCGSDGKTYTNIHKMNCAVRCGVGK